MQQPALFDEDFLPLQPERFIEPFLGGGSMSLLAASEVLVPAVIMVELDADVAAVWQTAFDVEEGAWLAHRIVTYELTLEQVEELLQEEATTLHERAFQTIVRNRVARGGILAPGAGLLKAGEGGKGIHSRWYPKTLARRLQHILALREHMTFFHGDGFGALTQYQDDPSTVFFIDPPCTAGTNGVFH